MRVLVFSGTTEGREAAARCLSLGFDTTVSVASGYGRELAEEDGGNVKILENRLSEGEMEELFKSFDCVVEVRWSDTFLGSTAWWTRPIRSLLR